MSDGRMGPCELCAGNPDYRIAIQTKINNKQDWPRTVYCQHGIYYVEKDIFYWWGITPSSEDPGYCWPP